MIYFYIMIYILTGPVHSGKSTFLKRLVDQLKNENIRIHGFLTVCVRKDQEIVGYDLLDLKEERTIPFIRREGQKEWERVGGYFFIPAGLAEAKFLIASCTKADILVVDEIGPLELREKGLWSSLRHLLLSPPKVLILTVRRNILEDFLRFTGDEKAEIFDIQEENVFSRMHEKIKKRL